MKTTLLKTDRCLNSVTAVVPKELYAKPGQFKIYLLDEKAGKNLKSLIFTVEE